MEVITFKKEEDVINTEQSELLFLVETLIN